MLESGAQNDADLPLSRFSTVDTRDLGEAEEKVGRIFCSHRLSPVRRGAPSFHAIHNNARHDGFSINYVAYGADVEIDPGCLDRFFLLQIPLAGTASVRCGTTVVEASPRIATLLSPTLPTLMRWHEGTEKLIILIERGVVESHLANLLGRSAGRIEFDPAVALDTPAGAALKSQVLLMKAMSEQMAAAHGHWPLAHRQLRDALTGQLLVTQRHNYSASLLNATAGPAPVHVRRAEAYIAVHAAEGLAADDIAKAAGVSLRTLQNGFRQFRDRTLSEAILDARLELWHQALRDPRRVSATVPPVGVAGLAAAVGLAHAGRNAMAYRRRFGESPSQTLRRFGAPRD